MKADIEQYKFDEVGYSRGKCFTGSSWLYKEQEFVPAVECRKYGKFSHYKCATPLSQISGKFVCIPRKNVVSGDHKKTPKRRGRCFIVIKRGRQIWGRIN